MNKTLIGMMLVTVSLTVQAREDNNMAKAVGYCYSQAEMANYKFGDTKITEALTDYIYKRTLRQCIEIVSLVYGEGKVNKLTGDQEYLEEDEDFTDTGVGCTDNCLDSK